MVYYGEMDPECVELCEAINLLEPDIYTIESCCGHGKRPFHIWFKVEDMSILPALLFFTDS